MFGWIYLCAAAYVAFSYGLSVSTNARFIRILEASRVAWRTKLYGFLDDADYRALAEKPLTDALAAYRRMKAWTTVIVAAVILLLLLGAASEWQWVDVAALIAAGKKVAGEWWATIRAAVGL